MWATINILPSDSNSSLKYLIRISSHGYNDCLAMAIYVHYNALDDRTSAMQSNVETVRHNLSYHMHHPRFRSVHALNPIID